MLIEPSSSIIARIHPGCLISTWINRFANGRNLPYKCMVLDEAYKDVFTSKCKDCSNNITWVPGDSEELVDNKYNNLLRDLLELRDGVVNTMVRSPYPST